MRRKIINNRFTKTYKNEADYTLEIFKIIVDTRKFEIEHFWKRGLFFWGTLAILIVGYTQVEVAFEPYSIFISFLATIYTLIFSLSIRGSKFWHLNWELRSQSFQKQLQVFYPKIDLKDLFGDPLHIEIKKEEGKRFPLLRSYRFSVSKLPILLSDLTFLFMLLLLVKDCIQLYSNVKWCLFDNNYKPHFIAISFTILFLISFVYIFTFIIGERNRNRKALQKELDDSKKKEMNS